VHLRGVIAGGTVGSSAFTLPAAASSPPGDEVYESPIVEAGGTGDLDISASGTVTPVQGVNATALQVQTYSSLEGVTYVAR
jgi:hypothetical protein